METGIEKNIQPVNIEDEMRGAYLDYAMSVIVGRALPDARDGLKPVQRRVLYAMWEQGFTHSKPYKKSARVVGDVIGKYHPHGDIAVYDTIVRLAQDFTLRYPLIDGQGNFGSVDGDSAAAMRYTEVRMEKVAEEVLADLEKETVDFGPNYDDSLQEPLVLPSRIPNLLVNGSSGIAVGMATSIPPHNLREIIAATLALIDDPNLKVSDLLKYVRGPDFPTGAFLFSGPGLREAYESGRGSVTLRARAEIEAFKGDRERIIVTEIPYQVNKSKLIEKIADLVRDKRVEGISDLRDESDRDGMRIVIEVKKGESANVLLNRLYKLTQLQESVGINLLAIHHKQPKTFNLRDLLWAFVEHRRDVVTRRTIYDLKKAEAKAHLLEGLKRALENIDAIVALIKAAKSAPEAESGLMGRFSFSEAQAKAILEMRLQRLTGLEREKLLRDLEETLALIRRLKEILGSEKEVFGVIQSELREIADVYGDDRRTEVVMGETAEFETEDLIEDTDTLVSITHSGYVKRADPAIFRRQGRGGKGVRGVSTGDEDFVTAIYKTTTLSYLLCITDKGRLYWLKVYKIPEAARYAKGKAVVNLLSLQPGERIKAILPVKDFPENEYVFMATRLGVVKKTALSEFSNVRSLGIAAISIDEGDELVAAKHSRGNNQVILASRDGMAIRFEERDVRAMGRSARGVAGMNLEGDDRVVAAEILDPSGQGRELLTITAGGYGKRTPVEDYRLTSRGAKGVITMRTTDKNGSVIACRQVEPNTDLMVVSNRGKMIRIRVAEISEQGRISQGVRLMSVDSGEAVVACEYLAESLEGSGGEPDAETGPGGNGSNGAAPIGSA